MVLIIKTVAKSIKCSWVYVKDANKMDSSYFSAKWYNIETKTFWSKPQWFKGKRSRNKAILAEKHYILELGSGYTKSEPYSSPLLNVLEVPWPKQMWPSTRADFTCASRNPHVHITHLHSTMVEGGMVLIFLLWMRVNSWSSAGEVRGAGEEGGGGNTEWQAFLILFTLGSTEQKLVI